MLFILANLDTGARDVLGGPVGPDNAALTILTVAAEDQPALLDLAVGESQRRYGTTADAKKPARNMRNHDKHQRPMIYLASRVE